MRKTMNFTEACTYLTEPHDGKVYRVGTIRELYYSPPCCYMTNAVMPDIYDIQAQYEIREDPTKLIKRLRHEGTNSMMDARCRDQLILKAADTIEQLLERLGEK